MTIMRGLRCLWTASGISRCCEPEEVLDTGWFSGPANRAILIHTRNFSDYVKESNEEYLGKEGALYYFNHTDFYGRTKLVKILVKDENGNRLQERILRLKS